MTTRKHVAVLMGGLSGERSISLSSGAACAEGLDAEGYRVTRIDVDRSIGSVLEKLRPDVAFNVLHGAFGEDGAVQGVLECLGIPYTHSGVLASALAMNKPLAKMVVSAAGVPVAPSRIVSRFEIAETHPMEPPYVIKPLSGGSSLGVLMVHDKESRAPALLSSADWAYGDHMMVERYVYGREFSCAVMGERALGVCEILSPNHAFYNYDSKYAPNGSTHEIPANILPNIYQKIQVLSVEAHRAIGCRGVSRSDFRLDDRFSGKQGEPIWLEINTQPGMASTSLLPELAAHEGVGFGDLLRWMVEDASCLR